MLPSICPREALLACPPLNLPWFTAESILSTPCSRSDSHHSRQSAALAQLDSPPLMIWCFGQTALFLFPLARAASAYLPIALSVATLSFSAGPVCSNFSAEACWSRQHHFSSLVVPSDSLFCPLLHYYFSYLKLCGRSVFSLLLFY